MRDLGYGRRMNVRRNPNGSIAFFDRLLVAVDVPVAIVQSGDSPTISSISVPSPDGVEMGDVRLDVRANLFGRYRDPFHVGLGSRFYFPTAGGDTLAGEGKPRVMPQASVSGRVGEEHAFLYAASFGWLARGDEVFDVVIVDFPDPTNFAIGKLYTTSFYALLDRRLAADGFAAVQTTSPLVARRSYWTVAATLEAVGFTVTPYHAHVPSFGEWGFLIASRRPFRTPTTLPPGLRFLTPEGMAALLQFPPDMARVAMPPNRLSDQSLVHTFEEEWGRVHQ